MPENIGHVIQVSGPVVDVQFEEANMPPIYEALRVVSDGFTVPRQSMSSSRCSSTLAKAAPVALPWRRLRAWCAV